MLEIYAYTYTYIYEWLGFVVFDIVFKVISWYGFGVLGNVFKIRSHVGHLFFIKTKSSKIHLSFFLWGETKKKEKKKISRFLRRSSRKLFWLLFLCLKTEPLRKMSQVKRKMIFSIGSKLFYGRIDQNWKTKEHHIFDSYPSLII